MLKNFAAKQQNPVVEDNMSNLTSASNEASVSSSNRADINGGGGFSQVQCSFPPSQPPPAKKKRNQPGHPDPDAEVIALSPTSLMATNRFICEICSKGFPRDQNLQLHRRGHNLPWKLKQRSATTCRRKVYVCPVAGCVHHDPGRALGDLTGIKKHFCRKHGEKKWKCDKCSKKYAVQSDWKAHSKTCGTKEYRCDCGTIFSRRDSFITHRAFCDALAEESARPQPKTTAAVYIPAASNNPQQIQSQFSDIYHHQIPLFPSIKKEPKNLAALLRPPPPPPPADFISPWLSSFHPPTTILGPTPAPSSSIFQHLQQNQDFSPQNPNPNPQPVANPADPRLPPYPSPPPPPPQISATALLQKAAQMGAKSSGPHQYPTPATDMSDPGDAAPATASFGLNLSSRDGLVGVQSSLFQNVIMGNPGTFDHHGHLRRPEFEETAFDGGHDEESLDFQAAMEGFGRAEDGGGQVSDRLTRDFLGLRGLSQSDILSMAGLRRCMDSNGGGGNES